MDRAAAIASYAVQSGDKTLESMCSNRGRAVRRLGELLKMQKDTVGLAKGGRPPKTCSAQGQVPAPLRPGGGVSRKLSSKAQRIAGIPEDEFEAKIESENPPSISQLAARHELSRPKPPGFSVATQAIGQLKEFARFCSTTDIDLILSGIEPRDVAGVRKSIATIDKWLDYLSVHLQGDS